MKGDASGDSTRGGRRVRVATLLSFPPSPGNGLGAYIVGLLDALRSRETLEVSLVAPDRVCGGAGEWREQLLLAAAHLRRLLRERPDVVHAHDQPVLLGAAVAYRIAARGSTRVVYSSHIDPAQRLTLWKRLILGWLFARCSAVVVVSRDSVRKLNYLSTPVPSPSIVQVIPGAATVHLRSKDDPAVAEFARSIGHEAGPVLLQVSNYFYEAKVEGTVRLLEAVARIRTRIPSVRLILLGTGPLLGSVKAAVERLRLERSVTIPGVFIEDLSLPLSLADVHCHISFQDACPISILEAMHAGKAVVASRTGGIPEMIEHGVTGMLVDGDPSHIASTITGLLEDPNQAKALGTNAQRSAHDRFTWERVAADFERLYSAIPPQMPAVDSGGGIAHCRVTPPR